MQGGVEILLVGLCYRNRDKLRPDGPLNWLVCRLYMKINKKEKLQKIFICQVLFRQIIVFYIIISEHRRI